MPKKGQYDLSDLDVSAVAPQKGKYTVKDLHPTPYADPSLDSGQLDPGSVANIANPIASATGRSTTSLPRAGLNLVGALGAGAEQALGIDPNNQIKSLTGVDPEHPISGTSVDSLKNSVIGQQIRSGLTSLPGYPAAPRPTSEINPFEGAANLATSIFSSPQQMAQGREEGDPDKFISGLGGTAAVTAPAIASGIEAGRGVYSNTNRPQPQFDPSKPGVVTPKVPRPNQDFARLHGGEVSFDLKNKLEQDVFPAIKDDLKQSEKDVYNRPVKTTAEYHKVLKNAAERIWNDYKPYLDQGSTINGDDVVNRAMGGYDKSVASNHPDEFNSFKKKVQEAFGGQSLSPEEAQHRLTQLNAEANGFYALNNAQDMASKGKLAGAQKYLATSDALRSVLNEHLPEGAQVVRDRYGNISEAMSGMPMPSESGKGFFKAMFDESAKAMSTRPGFAMMRGGLRAAGMGGTDKLVKRMFADTPYVRDPHTAPTTTITNPLTGEKQTVPVGPKAVVPPVTTPVQPHPMSPKAVLQGAPLPAVPNNPLAVPDLSGLNNAPPRLAPQRMQSFTPVSEGSRPQGVSIHSGIAPQLSSINQVHPPLPSETVIPSSTPGHPMTALPVNQQFPSMPHEMAAGVGASQPHGIQSGLNTSVGQVGEPLTPLTHPLSQGYSAIDTPKTSVVPDFRGNQPSQSLYGQPPAPLNVASPSEVMYRPPHVETPPQVPVRSALGGQFVNGFPSGEQLIPPPSETLKKLGKRVKINTGLKVKGY